MKTKILFYLSAKKNKHIEKNKDLNKSDQNFFSNPQIRSNKKTCESEKFFQPDNSEENLKYGFKRIENKKNSLIETQNFEQTNFISNELEMADLMKTYSNQTENTQKNEIINFGGSNLTSVVYDDPIVYSEDEPKKKQKSP